MNDKIVVCLGKGGQRDMAESFARKTGTSIVEKPGEYLTVLFDSKGVSLTGFGQTAGFSMRCWFVQLNQTNRDGKP